MLEASRVDKIRFRACLPCHGSQAQERGKQDGRERRHSVGRGDASSSARRGRVIDKAWSANSIHLARSIPVGRGNLLGAIARGGMEDGHGLGGAGAARGRGAAGQGQAEGHGVEEDVGGIGDVCDGAGEAVVLRGRVLQAGGGVEHLVGAQAVEGLGDLPLVGVVLRFAVGRVEHLLGGLGEEGVALGDVGGAGGVEDADDADEGFGGLEEGGGCS